MLELIPQSRARRAARRAVELPCEVVAEPDFRLLGNRALDLSTGGLLLQSEEEASPGDGVVLSFRAPGKRRWIDALGKVTRVAQGRRRTDRARCLGVRFDAMDPESWALLEACLWGRPPPVPARPLRRDYARMVQAIMEEKPRRIATAPGLAGLA